MELTAQGAGHREAPIEEETPKTFTISYRGHGSHFARAVGTNLQTHEWGLTLDVSYRDRQVTQAFPWSSIVSWEWGRSDA